MNEIALNLQETRALHESYLHLHAHPELSMQEHATADYIQGRLSDLGIKNFRCGGTGVVGIHANGPGPVIAFRADSDGLPIKEDTGADYASVATGVLADGTEVPVMHGCGHDTHVASALAAAQVLARSTDSWSGTVLWIFQPGEETAAGAQAMLADGLWDKVPHPQVVLGQHVFPFQTGSIAVTEGSAMALADSLKVTLFGKQSHGSQPQDSIDPIVLGAHIITRLQSIVSRELHPLSPAVITCGTFHAGLKENIIPDRAEFTLNIRTLTEEVRAQVLSAVTRIIEAEAVAGNAPAPLIEPLYNFPRLYNDPQQTQSVASAFGTEFGAEQVRFVPPAMGSEDFGALADALGVPNVFWMFGGFDTTAGPAPVNHSPHFLPDYVPALDTGVRAALAAIGYYVGSAS
ncbi:amidohydrolase [Arthrobacter sp. MYb211]|uniref:amidohydrolase n=1 Tax=unclassified Arthrobacter TaxID=235627 RepID=UPI000CFBCC32|nr:MULTISPECIES: amidohydrolase [unclassified Arthrobacter]PRA10037.1 amidohydrolase [Arthrobacter sp. MYb221]PRC05228.1 amidohydrolase [Arthrobacter sp. MYb211]